MWAIAHSKCDVLAQGQVAVDGATLAKKVEKYPLPLDSIIEIADTGSEIEMTHEGAWRRVVKLVSLSDYSGRDGLADNFAPVSTDICELITLAKFAAADDTRPKLSGVRIHEKGIAATDSYKFVLIDQDIPMNNPVTIPKRMVEHFPDPSSFGKGDIRFASSGQFATFQFGDSRELNGSVAAGEFPAIEMLESLVPEETSPYSLVMAVDHLKKMIEFLSAEITSNVDPVTIHPNGLIVVINPEGELSEHSLETSVIELPEPISFQFRFLQEIMRVITTEDEVTFRFDPGNPSKKPFVIERGSITMGVMPMRTT